MATKPATWSSILYLAAVLTVILFGSQMMHKLDLGTPKATKRLVGDWLGTFTLNGTYKPALYGATPGPHTGGVLFLHSYRQSPNLDWIEAKGEICLTGETTTRPIQLNIDDYKDDGSFSADFHTDPPLGAFPWHGTVTVEPAPATLTLSNDIELAIHANLHPGSRAAFRQLATCAPRPETD